MQYTNLLESSSIGDMQLKNKIVMAPMGSNFASEDGHASERLKAYYEERAKGGVGLIILETSAVSWPAGSSMPNMIGYSEDRFIPDLQDLTSRVHQYGAKIAAQLNHSGKISQEDVVAGREIPVPSIPKMHPSDMFGLLTEAEIMNFIKAAGPDGKGPRYHELTTEEIKDEIEHFVSAAKRAVESGFDAIEIHGGHGYLISSFLSPAVNKRTDEYGGSVENRARLLVEIISKIKSSIPSSIPVIVRLDAFEYRVEGGISTDDFLVTIKLAEEAGADALDISAYGNPAKGIAFTEAPLVHEPGGFIKFAKLAKAQCSIPILAVGRINLDVAESGIKNNDFDFVVMGRKLLADPFLPQKLLDNHESLIRPCIYCYVCVSKIFINQPMCCSVNSSMGKEFEDKDLYSKSNKKKNIVVIGSGPAGMESARILGERGHEVTVLEKEKDIGGTLRVASLAYEPNQALITYLKNSLKHLGIKIKTKTKANLEVLKKISPDHVLFATGAKRNAPQIPGKELGHVFDGEELKSLLISSNSEAEKKLNILSRLILKAGNLSQLLRNISTLRVLSKFWMPLKKELVIIGGDLVGLELAEFLTERGKKITVVEPSNDLGPNLSIVRRSRVIHLLKSHGVNIIKNAKDIKISNSDVNFELDGTSQSIKANQVIIAMGTEPNTEFADELKENNFNVSMIGDCTSVGYIEGAISDARIAVKEII